MSLLMGIMNVIECNPNCGLWIAVYHHNNAWACQIYSRDSDGVELAFDLSSNDEDYILTGIEQVTMLIEIADGKLPIKNQSPTSPGYGINEDATWSEVAPDAWGMEGE